jgi:hypothetical protein
VRRDLERCAIVFKFDFSVGNFYSEMMLLTGAGWGNSLEFVPKSLAPWLSNLDRCIKPVGKENVDVRRL